MACEEVVTIDPTPTTQPEVAPASKSSSFPPSSYPEEGETGVFLEASKAVRSGGETNAD